MKKISVIILAIVIVACASSNKNVLDGVEIVPVDVHKASKDASSFLEKIEKGVVSLCYQAGWVLSQLPEKGVWT